MRRIALLTQIERPADLKRLSKQGLRRLCKEIRETIISTVSENGGHMASNLGVVELTVALHLAFDCPKDKLVFDVGHQSYTHKLLTGRREAFSTLRKKDGLSGFPNPRESEYDAFQTGHSSTAISAALGMARARDMSADEFHVVAVVGDGSLTGGMAYEALDDAVEGNTPLIVVLNDNEMSISKNVGGMSNYLSKVRSSPRYHGFKNNIRRTLGMIPFIGKGLVSIAEWIKRSIKSIFIRTVIFEELGFTYIGPMSGHDIGTMVAVFSQAKELRRPVLIHVVTQKGYGYKPALEDPEKFHGISPYIVETTGKGDSCSNIFGKTMIEMAKKDRRIVAITAAMPMGTGLSSFAQQYPKRFFDVGIAEQHAVTMAAGMAKEGIRPYVAIYSTFLQRTYDQILMDVCLQNLPVTFCIDRAGLVGEDGETHHGIFDLSMLLPMPNMRVMQPATQTELREMLEFSRYLEGPIAIRYPRGLLAEGEWGSTLVKEGASEILFPVALTTVIAVGDRVAPAYRATRRLREAGEKIGLVNLRSVKPLDDALIASLQKTCRRVLVVENHIAAGGAGDALQSALKHSSGIRVEKLAIQDTFIRQGEGNLLLQELGLDEEGIYRHIKSLIPAISLLR